jgi:hypothetical protein
MKNCFLYSKSISFLMGRTRLVAPVSRCSPPVGLHLSLWSGLRVGEKTPNPSRSCPVPAAGTDSSPHAVPRTSRHVASGLPTPPSLSDCRWSSLRAVVTRWPIAPQRAATVSCAMQPQCPEHIVMRQPVQHGPLPRLGIIALPLPLPSACT